MEGCGLVKLDKIIELSAEKTILFYFYFYFLAVRKKQALFYRASLPRVNGNVLGRRAAFTEHSVA